MRDEEKEKRKRKVMDVLIKAALEGKPGLLLAYIQKLADLNRDQAREVLKYLEIEGKIVEVVIGSSERREVKLYCLKDVHDAMKDFVNKRYGKRWVET